MSAKQTKPAATVTTELTIAPVVEAKPETLSLLGPIAQVLAESAVHIRNGMIFSDVMPVDMFPATGQMQVHLIRGNPDQHFVEVAKVTSAEAVELQAAQYERQIQEAARQLVENTAKAAKKAELEAAVAAAADVVRKLKADLAKA